MTKEELAELAELVYRRLMCPGHPANCPTCTPEKGKVGLV